MLPAVAGYPRWCKHNFIPDSLIAAHHFAMSE